MDEFHRLLPMRGQRYRVSVCGPVLLVLLGLLPLAACDTAPGAQDIEESAPEVSSLGFDPGFINLDDVPPGDVTDGVARVTISVDVTVVDQDNDATMLYVFVLPPDASAPITGEETQDLSGNGARQVDVELLIPTAAVGIYTVKVYASDRLGHLGNQATGSLQVTATNSPPTIVDIDLPAVIVRPAPGQPAVEIPIVVTVEDPDGIANVSRVEMLVNGSGPLFLCDDGGNGVCNAGFPPSGDEVAGDGRFTITIQLDASNSPGDNLFEFTAVDRGGLESATEQRTVEVQ